MRRGFKPKKKLPYYRLNQQIQAQELRLLDETGKQIGMLRRNEAIEKAEEAGLDLVEIAPNASPPVVKLIDFKKFLYQQKKKRKEQKSSTSETKEVWLGPFIDNHDLEIKLARTREFIKEGNKVRLAVKFRWREMRKKELGEEVLKKVIESVRNIAKVDREIHMEGRQMVMILSKIK